MYLDFSWHHLTWRWRPKETLTSHSNGVHAVFALYSESRAIYPCIDGFQITLGIAGLEVAGLIADVPGVDEVCVSLIPGGNEEAVRENPLQPWQKKTCFEQNN